MRRIFFFCGLILPSLAFADSSAKDLIQRVYVVEGRPQEILVLREVRQWRDDKSLDGLRLYQRYESGRLADFRLERFGQAERSGGEGLDFVKEMESRDAAPLADSITLLFAEAISKELMPRPNDSGVMDLQAHPTGRQVYYYEPSSPASSSGVDDSLRAGADEWRQRSQELLQQKEVEKEARRGAIREQGHVRLRLEENFRDLTAKTAVSALGALEGSAKSFETPGASPSRDLIEKERYLNSSAQDRERRDIEALAKRGNWAEVARRVADFESPRSRFPSLSTLNWLRSSEAVKQIREHSYFNREALPRFRDAALESEKLVIGNLLQAVSLTRASRTRGTGGVWLRSSALLVEAAGLAERAGRPRRARELLSQARTIAAYFAEDSEGRAIRIVTDARGRKTFLSETTGPSMSRVVSESSREAWAASIDILATEAGDSTAEPTRFEGDTPSTRSLHVALNALRKGMGKSSNAYLRAGGIFLGYSEKATTSSDVELLNSMVVMSIDIAVGFVPPAAVVKGVYEFATGRHLLTGKKLTKIDRGFALLSALTFGGGTLALKGVQAIGRITPYSTEARLIFTMADEMRGALQASGGRFASSMIETYRKALPAVATTEEAVQLVKAQSLVTAGRLRKMPVAAEAWSWSGVGNSVLHVRALSDRQKMTLVALPGVLHAHRMIVKSSEVEGLTWPQLREKYDLPEGPPPEKIRSISIHEGDFLKSTRSSSGHERLEFMGLETDRNFGPERPAVWAADGSFRP